MKRHLLSIFSIVMIGALISSCSTSSDLANNSPIKKRRYTKGFHLDFKKTESPAKYESTAELSPSQNSDLVKPESHTINGLEPIASSKAEMSAIIDREEPVFGSESPEPSVKEEIAQFELPPAEYNTDRQRKRELKDAFNRYDDLNQPAAVSGEPQWLYYVLAIIIPPLAIGLLYGITLEFWISLVLTLLFWLPGAIYSLIMTLKYYGEM